MMNCEESGALPANVSATFNASATKEIHMPVYLTVTISVVNIVVFVVGMLGNMSVILVVSRVKTMRSPINYCFLSLSISDILVLVVCQLAALVEFYANEKWLLGVVICRISLFLENATNYASILTVMAISFERYIAICKPLSARNTLTHSTAFKLIAILWTIAYTVGTPFVVMSHLERTLHSDGTCVNVCTNPIDAPWKHVYVTLTIIVFFVLPVLLLSVLYVFIIRTTMRDDNIKTTRRVSSGKRDDDRNKSSLRQAVYILLAVIVLFFVSLLPSRVIILWSIYAPVSQKRSIGMETFTIVLWFGRVMLYINSAGNPIIYNAISARFRKALKQALGVHRKERMNSIGFDKTRITQCNDGDNCVSYSILLKAHNSPTPGSRKSSAADRTSSFS